MASLTDYNGLLVLTDTSADGGEAINDNFKKLSTKTSTSDPGMNDDEDHGYCVGSRWLNTSSNKEFICRDSAAGAAVWAVATNGALLASNNLSDVASAATARTNLGLSGALLASNNLSDVASAATSRTNLGLGTAATASTGTGPSQVPLNSDGSGLASLSASNLASGTVPTARLGSGSATSTSFLRGDQTWATLTTTQGDLVVGGATGSPARLAIGSTGQFLKSSGSTPAWANPGMRIIYVDDTASTASGTTFTSFLNDYTFTANELAVHDVYRATWYGEWGQFSSTPSVGFAVFFGSTTNTDTFASQTYGSGGGHWRIQTMFVVTAAGTSGTLATDSIFQAAPSGTSTKIQLIEGGTQSINTTVSLALTANVKYSGPNAANVATCRLFILEKLTKD